MTARSHAREIVLQMMFQRDLNSETSAETVRAQIHNRLPSDPLRDFAWKLYLGIVDQLPEVDQHIVDAADNWSLDRIAPTDRNALRIGIYELLHTDTPPRVALDESITLAKRFGGASSPQFVNGILDKVAAICGRTL
ncbi:MAG: transcription antitermination factor NusB [Planctomycetaceae bacterium]